MKHQDCLLIYLFNRHERRYQLRRSVANHLGVGRIVLVPINISVDKPVGTSPTLLAGPDCLLHLAIGP